MPAYFAHLDTSQYVQQYSILLFFILKSMQRARVYGIPFRVELSGYYENTKIKRN